METSAVRQFLLAAWEDGHSVEVGLVTGCAVRVRPISVGNSLSETMDQHGTYFVLFYEDVASLKDLGSTNASSPA